MTGREPMLSRNATGPWGPERWVWMPHAGHFVGERCDFRLNTYVGTVLVSSVGEYRRTPDGDIAEIGVGRLYETMVFRAAPAVVGCCPWEIVDAEAVEVRGYNTPAAARAGHLALCREWAAKQPPEREEDQ